MKTNPRRGFTLVELLVVIAIIGTLMALLIPAVQGVRERMRTTNCLNNMRQAGTAALSYESAKQRFPGYAQSVKRGTNVWVAAASTSGGEAALSDAAFLDVPDANQSRVSWAGVILPYMDNQALWDSAVELGNTFPIRRQEIYICPSDSELAALADNAGLSYVINAGAWDYSAAPASDADAGGSFIVPGPMRGDTADNGLCHNHVAGRSNVKSTLAGIRDGASQTLLLAENIHKNQGYCWFGVSPPKVPEQYFGMVWVVNTMPNFTQGSSPSIDNQAPISQEPIISFDNATPTFARPASNHAGVFNAMFAGGNGRSINNNIDYIVYQQMMTPHQRKCVNPMDHSAVTGSIQAFRNFPPLSPSDYE